MQINDNLTTVNYNHRDSRNIKYIVVHYTANKNDTAYNNTRYFKDTDRGASAHYFVDDTEIWRCVQDMDVAWHCGAKSYRHPDCRNANSIGVEMCTSYSSADGYYISTATTSHTVELVRHLMEKYDIPPENVLRHYDVTGKNCPAPWVVNSRKWQEFLNMLEEEIDMEVLEQLREQISALEAENARQNEVINRMGGEIQELRNPMIYNYIDGNMPDWAKPAIQKLVGNGMLKGNENGELMLTDEQLRTLTILDRTGVFGRRGCGHILGLRKE